MTFPKLHIYSSLLPLPPPLLFNLHPNPFLSSYPHSFPLCWINKRASQNLTPCLERLTSQVFFLLLLPFLTSPISPSPSANMTPLPTHSLLFYLYSHLGSNHHPFPLRHLPSILPSPFPLHPLLFLTLHRHPFPFSLSISRPPNLQSDLHVLRQTTAILKFLEGTHAGGGGIALASDDCDKDLPLLDKLSQFPGHFLSFLQRGSDV